MATDRTVRFLQALGGASTSRVLNLGQVARVNRETPEHGAQPLFTSPILNTSFILKHRVRSDETYLFNSARSVVTKIIIPFDLNDLRAGGRSLFIDQRGFIETLKQAGNYTTENMERDLGVLRLLNAVPSLDPFLVREHLRNHDITVADCYFAISAGDQKRMHDFVSGELGRLMQMATGQANSDGSANRMVTAMLSSQVDEKLAPLRATLGLTGQDFREGVFSWRGFLYYKWSMGNFWPHVMAVLREVQAITPNGQLDAETRTFLTAAKRSIIEMVRDNGKHINKVLAIYDNAFEQLVANQSPKTFRDFLLSAPHMFLELGEKMGSISHIVSFWRYRFPADGPKLVDAEELATIFHDFTSGFAERMKEPESVLARPNVIDVTMLDA